MPSKLSACVGQLTTLDKRLVFAPHCGIAPLTVRVLDFILTAPFGDVFDDMLD